MTTALQQRLVLAGFTVSSNNNQEVSRLKGKKILVTMPEFPERHDRTVNISAAFINNDETLVLDVFSTEDLDSDIRSFLIRKDGTVVCNHMYDIRGTQGQTILDEKKDSFTFILN